LADPASRGRSAAWGGGWRLDPATCSDGAAAQSAAAGGWLTLGQLGPALEQLLRDEARRYGIEPQDG
jgi:hypothetical protein